MKVFWFLYLTHKIPVCRFCRLVLISDFSEISDFNKINRVVHIFELILMSAVTSSKIKAHGFLCHPVDKDVSINSENRYNYLSFNLQ